ncbi:MAG: hypothetical protein K2X48_17145 [Chitinophagaceae bacterium]|nr:hypothetical protein [Chitinophagaceae bacterium]
MKKLNLLFVFIVFAAAFTACKKKDCPAPTYPAEGLWVGKYGSGTATPTSGFSMVLEAGGKVTVADGDNVTSSSKAAGTWTVTGNVFKATYTYPASGGGTPSTYTIQANWSNNGKMTSGTWGSGTSPTGSGTWFMDRKN